MKKGYKGIAILLSAVMVSTSVNLLTKAADDKPIPPKIVSFAELPADVLEQTVYVGDDISSVILPASLTATVETTKKVETKKEIKKEPVVVPETTETQNPEMVVPKGEKTVTPGETGTTPETPAPAGSESGETTETPAANPASEQPTQAPGATPETPAADPASEQPAQAPETSPETPAADPVPEQPAIVPETTPEVPETPASSDEGEGEPQPAPEQTPAPETPAQEPESGGESGEASEGGESARAILDSLFPATKVYAAEYENPSDGETQYETVTEMVTSTEETAISVTWKIEVLKSSGIKFSSDIAGNKFVFAPEISSDYKVSAALPKIVVTVAEKKDKVDNSTADKAAKEKADELKEKELKEKELKEKELKEKELKEKELKEKEEKEKEKKVETPAFSKAETVGDYYISVDAPAGVFPEGTTVSVNVVSNSASLIEGQVDGDRTIEDIVTFDISFWHDGKEIEPENGKVNVSIALASEMKETLKSEDTQLQVFHIDDDNRNVEEVACTTNGEEVMFSAESFSRYVLVTSSGAAKKKLDTPTNLNWDTSQVLALSWDAVTNADKYIVQIKVGTNAVTETVITSATTVDLVQTINNLENTHQTSFNGEAVYASVKAQADSTGKSYLYYDSDFSAEVSKTYTNASSKKKLDTPDKVSWVDGQILTLSWEPVQNASQYEVKFSVEGYNWTATAATTTTNIELVEYITRYENKYQQDYNGKNVTVQVKAQVDSSGKGSSLLFYDSDYSPQVSKTYVRQNGKTKLATPANVRWLLDGVLTLAWDPVPNASQYVVEVQVADNTWVAKETTKNNYLDLVELINKYENLHQEEYAGQAIKAKVKAQADQTLTTTSLLFYDSDFSPVVTKDYSRPAAIVSDSRLGIAKNDSLLRVLEASLTSDQKSSASGKQLEFDFNFISGVSTDAATVFNFFATQNKYKVGETFDLSLRVKADGTDIGSITQTNSEIPIAVSIPANLQYNGRTFVILGYHGGVLFVAGTGSGTDVLIRTKQFSPYAILYYDPPANNNNDNNDNKSSSSSSSSSSTSDGIWRPTTPDEIKRAAVVGKEQYAPYYDGASGYGVTIKNVMQGPLCFVSFEAVLQGYTIARTYDFWPNGQKVRSANKEITITLNIPAALQKADRDFRMICVTTGGLPIVLQDLDNNPATITIKTDKFYAFALVFKDGVKNQPAPTQTTKKTTTKKKKK
ncbi:MAG: hypothetical protein IJU77_06150 [Butyrivibrio sp.]|nr:hypothetical protein [Butyrivibrio sp.]